LNEWGWMDRFHSANLDSLLSCAVNLLYDDLDRKTGDLAKPKERSNS
jgi:hypothetical protein